MGFKSFLGFLMFVIFMGFLNSCQAYEFLVGGKDGWGLNPSENYNHWAERNRFQINDTLLFKYYKNGSDSVLVVTKDSYYSCNTTNPIQSLTDGTSIFKFDRSGPFFFISGSGDNCQKGQKLVVVVLAVRNKTHQAPSPSPSPEREPPVSPAPTLDGTPASPSPSPEREPPLSPAPTLDSTPASDGKSQTYDLQDVRHRILSICFVVYFFCLL
ncbi:Early nodulin-like protein 1 [Morella rubra]|uniref:Early nodulin-like protein 1 n=1 Tax=Morella rubra TaxID=262757 RepID=A0A6A1WV65_9ROSI|nr:Early nodulin-like protein 1 [Morella rubra]